MYLISAYRAGVRSRLLIDIGLNPARSTMRWQCIVPTALSWGRRLLPIVELVFFERGKMSKDVVSLSTVFSASSVELDKVLTKQSEFFAAQLLKIAHEFDAALAMAAHNKKLLGGDTD